MLIMSIAEKGELRRESRWKRGDGGVEGRMGAATRVIGAVARPRRCDGCDRMDSSCRLIKRPQKYLRRRVWDAPEKEEERQQRQWRVPGWSKRSGDQLNITARPPDYIRRAAATSYR
jgi:hypothetical protein